MRIDGCHVHDEVTLDRVAAAAERRMSSLDNPGFCIACGNEVEGVEPDACKYTCEACGARRVKVYLEGAMQTRKWTDQKGIDRYTTEVVLNSFNSVLVMLDRAERAPGPEPEAYGTQRTTPSTTSTPRGASLDDEIPF